MANQPQRQDAPAADPKQVSAAPAAAAKPAPIVPLNQTRLKESSFIRTEWFVTCPAKTKIEDLSAPEFWRNVGHMFKQFDDIIAVSEDATWYARFTVINASRLWAKVAMVLFVDLTESHAGMPLTDDQNHCVEWKGPLSKFAVIRKSDSAILKDGFQTNLEGWQWLDGHLKSLAA